MVGGSGSAAVVVLSAHPRREVHGGALSARPDSRPVFQCVGHDTRARPGEVDGVDYRFVTTEQFQNLIDDGELLEWAEIHGGLHRSGGTPAAPVREATKAGVPVLIEVDLAGARAVKAAMPEVTTVFLAPPSWEALEERLIGRGTESPEVQARRLATARAELAAQKDFDVVVVNSQLESACAELVSLLVAH